MELEGRTILVTGAAGGIGVGSPVRAQPQNGDVECGA